jgi:sugar (pentulose or hexulose) kinase
MDLKVTTALKKLEGQTHLLAIDLGASEAKCYCGVFEGGRFTMEEIYRFEHQPVSLWLRDDNGESVRRTFCDDTGIFRQIIQCFKYFSKNVSDRLDAVSIDSWGTDGQLITENGELVGRMFSYRDSQPVKLNPAEKALTDDVVYLLSGIPLQKHNVRNRLLWLFQNRPEIRSLKLRFLPLPTIFSCYLGAKAKIDHTWASVTQLMDIERRQWNKQLVDSLNLPGLTLPEIVPPGTIIGSLHDPLAAMVALNQAPIIATASHDTAAAFYSASVKPDGSTLVISSGTWSLVGKVIRQPILSVEAQKLKMSNQLGPDNVHFIYSITGHWIIQALRKIWRVEDGHNLTWEEMIQLAKHAEPFKAFINPDHIGFFNPDKMTEAIDAFCLATGQKPPREKGMYLRTVLESLALKYRWVNERTSKLCGRKTDSIRVIGGGSRNDLLNQFTADCIGVPVMAGPVQGSAIGNLMIQALGLGILKSRDEVFQTIAQVASIKEFFPRDRVGWNGAYEDFQRIVDHKPD